MKPRFRWQRRIEIKNPLDFKQDAQRQLEEAYKGLIRHLREAGKLKILAIPKERHRFSLVLEI